MLIGHSVHDTEPLIVLYVPATQAVHGPQKPSGPVKPGPQVAETQSELPTLQVDSPVAHTRQVVAADAANVPMEQTAHSELPLVGL